MRQVRRAGWVGRRRALGDSEPARWYSIREFLDLKDVEDDAVSRAPLPPESRGPLPRCSGFVPHTLGSRLERSK